MSQGWQRTGTTDTSISRRLTNKEWSVPRWEANAEAAADDKKRQQRGWPSNKQTILAHKPQAPATPIATPQRSSLYRTLPGLNQSDLTTLVSRRLTNGEWSGPRREANAGTAADNKKRQQRGWPSNKHPYWPTGTSRELQRLRLRFLQSSFLPSHEVFCGVQSIGLDNNGQPMGLRNCLYGRGLQTGTEVVADTQL
ncbi:hypothetical protein EJ02DRAFT_40240 [Clathrospora elynae]|uniref:Uncharacterized protein n=1 Tax=Clathrospora elynae TaxID=706981 RepID=A0A6A5SE02_9PLEO|nr:hypothetical protein EJ02DRAFT_40240 [Clathrospora elynae]